MLIYVSGPLQGAADLVAARALYVAVAAAVESAGNQAYVPHLHTDPEAAAGIEPSSVYDRDVAALLDADAVVAHVGAPSTGVGAELAIAHHAGLRIVGLLRTGEPVSRFAQGLIERAGGVLVAFDRPAELPRLLPPALAAAVGRGRTDSGHGTALAQERAG